MNYQGSINITIDCSVGEAAAPVLSLVSSFSLLTSRLMDWVLTWLAPVGLVSLIANQVGFS